MSELTVHGYLLRVVVHGASAPPGVHDSRVGDWRLMGQDAYLVGRRLRLRLRWPYREGWDHDHCAFCQRHISVPLATDDADALDRGYVTEDYYHWHVRRAFADFCESFNWTVLDQVHLLELPGAA